MIYQVDISQTISFFDPVLKRQLNDKEMTWLNHQKKKIEDNFNLRDFYLAFTSASRFIRKKPLVITEERLAKANGLRKGFQPENWNLLQSVRIYFLSTLPNENAENYQTVLSKLFETADMEEQVTLYRSLPLLPYPEIMAKPAVEGIRTNITDFFDAIALHNPFPGEFLEQGAWNQMLLKAVFMQRPLHRIYGADERANPELARMLMDFAHERWAANRPVTPELWRFVAPFLNEDYFGDLEKVVKNGQPLEKKAGLLACASGKQPEAQQLLDQYPEIKEDIQSGRLNWTKVGEENENNS